MSRPLLLGALFVSLALNVFIGGAFVGAHLAKSKEPPAAVAGFRGRNPLVQAVRALPPESQAAWREGGRAFAQTYGPKAREARKLARETMRGFGDEPFDKDAALAALAKARAAEHENRMAMDRRIVEFAATLPRDQRKVFGEALARPPQRPMRPPAGSDGEGERN
ncbi:periplasmic heavy metal sensor [Phenylobacterium sp.]|uniref:periplasmic heavy metal sensor n=1 Tax=Phenylobacterium sp. TaxID=1871053 RepID=UPI002EDA074D